jgi:DNA replication regulator DPB11
VLRVDELDNVVTDDLNQGFLVLPHDTKVDLTSGSLPERAGCLTLVTNWWVERCLYGKILVDPTNDVLSRPFDKLRISGMSQTLHILLTSADVATS